MAPTTPDIGFVMVYRDRQVMVYRDRQETPSFPPAFAGLNPSCAALRSVANLHMIPGSAPRAKQLLPGLVLKKSTSPDKPEAQ